MGTNNCADANAQCMICTMCCESYDARVEALVQGKVQFVRGGGGQTEGEQRRKTNASLQVLRVESLYLVL